MSFAPYSDRASAFMPVLQLDDKQFPLTPGANRIGTGTDADVMVPGDSTVGVQAVIEAGLAPTIRRAAPAAQVRVNGVLLGAEPTPLMHGDKVEVAGLELRYADDAKGGATQFVSASEIAAITGAKRTGAARATAASGGRLVSLVDGKEYTVAETGLVFGRDASCDVVVAQNEVSRRHAEIVPGEQGYLLRDTSANGVFVNGERVQGSHRLARADVVRIGTEEFRFYADMLPSVPPAVAPPVAPPRPAVAPAAPPSPAAKDPRPVMAILEAMNEGPGKGTKYELRTPLAHVGRGAHNDVRLSDESVSETHAKLQKREDGWHVVDMDSTNGTYIGGHRVVGERRIEGSPDVRFGGMKFRFTAVGTGVAVDLEGKGTRAIAALSRPPAMAASHASSNAPPGRAPAAPPPTEEPEKSGESGPSWVWITIVLAIVGVAFFVLKGRT